MDLQSIHSGQYFTASAPNAAEKQIIVAKDVHAMSIQHMNTEHSKTVERCMRMNVPGGQCEKSNKERFYNGK